MSFIAADYVFCCNGSGPNALTISDFIQMIWDQKPPVVVMLTRLFEKGKVSIQFSLTTQMSIVIYAGVTFVEKVNERDYVIDKPVGTDKCRSCQSSPTYFPYCMYSPSVNGTGVTK